MVFFYGMAAILFFVLALFVAFAPDILLKMDRIMDTPMLTQREIIKTRKGVRFAISFLFLFASFWMGLALFTGSYKVLKKPAPFVDYHVD
ncbi:MAG: hypothetical protein COX40_00540 [Candidatus Omnitrophica bacterium CG23_combo_of_CG06-09_8_20_14_all_40_11]|nr:MAG: hypothetical protein COX40_00540 [Candidatus Omnitrophica bacterium CG23_combo_of_CG06-09_8_20_14_all_40_11]